MSVNKRYILHLEGDVHPAMISRPDGRRLVRIGETEAQDVDERWVLNGKALSVEVDGRLHLVHLSRAGDKGEIQATLGGRPVKMTVLDELRAQALESMGSVAGSGIITADIPGLVVELKVEPGQMVPQGEPVIVVEAMKMQNELTAAVAGIVKEISVAVGDSVNPGDRLVVIEPEPGG